MRTNRRSSLAALAIMILLVASTVTAQDAASPEGKKLERLWEDMLHYIKIARPQLAQSFGRAILEYPGLKPEQLYMLQRNTPKSAAVLSKSPALP